MSKKIILTVIGISLLLVGGGVVLVAKSSAPVYTGLDDFAKCLDSKGAVMYGAAWCPHCQNTKKTFGDSFKFIKYVECPLDTKTCLDKGIQGYPTWIFGTGIKLEGEQSLDQLSKVSSCPLPETQ